jgi:hypothetical protein
MKRNQFVDLVDEVVAEKFKIADEYIKDVVEAIGDVGNPEALIGKKYEDWTPQDLQLLSNVYGQGDDSPLSKLIASKEYEKVLNLESEVI